MSDRSLIVLAREAKKGGKYHRSSCHLAARILKQRRTTIGRAKKEGYVACAQCNPE